MWKESRNLITELWMKALHFVTCPAIVSKELSTSEWFLTEKGVLLPTSNQLAQTKALHESKSGRSILCNISWPTGGTITVRLLQVPHVEYHQLKGLL